MDLIIGVIRVGVIGVLVFLNRNHLIESYYVLRKSVPKKMVKCADRGVLRNITKTESRKFDMLVSLPEKSINAGVQVNLQPATAVYICSSIDKEEFQKMKEINQKLENRLTQLEEMIRRVDEKQKYRDLQDLTDKVDILSNYQQSLTEKIDGELMTIGSDVETIKNCYAELNTIFHELENKFISLERNTEKPMRKYDAIKTRITTLERDVMKNTSHVIGMDHFNRSMDWTRLQYFGSTGMFPPADNHCYGEPAAFAAASSCYNMPPVPRPPAQYFVPPVTPFEPAAPPPPAPPAPSAFFQPPPPAPQESSTFLSKPLTMTPKKTGLQRTGSDESNSSSVITPKVEKVYDQIPITTAMLKSVVLKPPYERKRVSKSAAI